MIDLARQDFDASMAYGLEPELTSWPASCPQEGGWMDLSTGARTELAEAPEGTEPTPAPSESAPTERKWLPVEDCWFFGAYRRYHAGLEPPEAGPTGWRPGLRGSAVGGPPRAPAIDHERDRELRAEVLRALRADVDFAAHFVQVRCIGGEVSLSGSVPGGAAKWRAKKIVEAIPGVVAVHDRLRILTPTVSGWGA